MQNLMKGSQDDELLNLGTVSGSQIGSGNATSPQVLESIDGSQALMTIDGSQALVSIDGSQALEKDNVGLPVWNLSCEVENYLSQGTDLSEELSEVWPPMLLVCIQGIEAKAEALDDVRECLVGNGLQADKMTLTEFVCLEGNTFYDLFVLPPTGLSFAAAKAADGIIKRTYTCYYPSLKDMLDIKNNSRIPEFSRRFILNLRYHGMARQAWIDLYVDLLRDDGICVARGVCVLHEPTDCVDDEVLGDLHVGVQVLDIFEDFLSLDWKGSVRRWEMKNVLHAGVSFNERLRQHTLTKVSGSYCEDSEVDIDVQQAQGVLKDQSLTSVAPWGSSCADDEEFEDDEGFDSLTAECSKTCQDAIRGIENSSSQTPAKDDFEEKYCGGLPFEKKLLNDEETRMKQILVSIKNSSTKRVLMKHLAASNGFHLAKGVVKRLKVLHKLTQSRAHSTPINIMIKAVKEMELSTLRSIEEQVQQERQRESVLGDLETIGKKAILELREHQHQTLMKLLEETETSQVSKLEEFVNDKFEFISGTQKTKKETESIVDWLSQHITRATDEVKRAHMMEKRKLEEQIVTSKAAFQAARRETIRNALQLQREAEKAAKLEIKLQSERRETAAKTEMLEFELRIVRRQAAEKAAKLKFELQTARLEAEEKAKSEIELSARKLEAEEQAAKSQSELQAIMRNLDEQIKCAICFEKLEETSGIKRNRDDVVLRKRACFIPCMHASMCCKCSEEAWENFKRCPVCNTPCPTKPQLIFV